MERRNNYEQRDWKKFYYQLGERAVEMCQSETMLFSHSEPYMHYDLIQHPTGLYPRDENQELFDALIEEDFTEVYQHYPNPRHENLLNEHWQNEVVEGAELILELEDEK